MSAHSRVIASTPQVHPEVEDHGRVRQRADRDEVDAGLGDVAGAVEGETAGGLEGGVAVGDLHGLGHLVVGHVVEQDPLAARVEQLAELVEVGHLHLDGEVRVRGADRLEGRDDPAGREHVVVLDHRQVDEAEPVVDAAAAAHGVLLQGAEAGQGLAGVEHPGLGALERGHPVRGGGGDAGEVRGEVQGGALGGQQATDGSGRRA